MTEYGAYQVQKKRTKEEKIDCLLGLMEALSKGKTQSEYAREVGVSYAALYRWIDDPEIGLKSEIARAREVGCDHIAEDTLSIADSAPERDKDGKIDPGDVANRKLRIWTRQQLLSKWAPKKYGDKVTLAGDEESPIKHSVDVNFV